MEGVGLEDVAHGGGRTAPTGEGLVAGATLGAVVPPSWQWAGIVGCSIPAHQVPLPGPANLTCHWSYPPPARGHFCVSSHWERRWSERCSSVKEEGLAGTCPMQTRNPNPGDHCKQG